jgi:hypothetical protein
VLEKSIRQPFSKIIVQYIHSIWQGQVKVKVRGGGREREREVLGGRFPLFPPGTDCCQFFYFSAEKSPDQVFEEEDLYLE